MILKKENKTVYEVIIYTFIFIVICLFPVGIKYLLLLIISLDKFNFFNLIPLAMIITLIIQFCAGLLISWNVLKNKNSFLQMLYNNFKLPFLILLLFILLDVIIILLMNQLVKTDFDFYLYIMFLSLTKNFLPIYIVAIINTIRLKKTEIMRKSKD